MQQETRDAVRTITFDRPEALCSFRVDDYSALTDAIAEVAADPDVRAVVLTGQGRAFSAGADRSLIDGTSTAAELERAAALFDVFLETLTTCPKPVLAAVNGLAVGIGATMLLHCDLILLAASARLRFPFTALGLSPEAGSSALLPAFARRPDAVWALLSSEWIDSATAHSMGFAWRVVADDALPAAAHDAAATLAALDPAAVAATKSLVNESRTDAFRAAHARELVAMHTLRHQT